MYSIRLSPMCLPPSRTNRIKRKISIKLAVFTKIRVNLPSSSLASGAICSKPPTELVIAAKIIDTSPSKTPFSCLIRTGTVRIPGKSSTPLAK